ncbi:hypothetical protein FB45DRAFT_1032907 [Roridomyces roridus]|uniref:Uncharacterized protein n=1 Tax=Roridomyces roridus TaxID=1738132 RepID=A0AAD7BGN3_9AGAR|nr:hypothetical protein FB45DRAFT_1032907 [Roridomyces roridus]
MELAKGEQSPTLPPELERHIFEICAFSRPATIPKLVLVAHRVKQWLEPTLYRALVVGEPQPFHSPDGEPWPVLTRSTLSSTIRRKSTEFVRNSVRNIFFEQFCGPFLVQILTVCPEVENLYLRWQAVDLNLSGFRLPGLKKLSIRDPVVLTPTPAYSHITHLHMSSNPGSESDTDVFYASILQCLPSLTHLSLSHYGYRRILLPLLQNCPLLEVLVYFTCERDFTESLADDVRFVVYGDPDSYHRFNDWWRGVCSGDDHWYYAERLIEKRRSGEVESRLLFM